MSESEKPRLIVVAGRYARSLANCRNAASLADRAYVYDNSLENTTARLIVRTVNGKLVKTYGAINPWAQAILAKINQDLLKSVPTGLPD